MSQNKPKVDETTTSETMTETTTEAQAETESAAEVKKPNRKRLAIIITASVAAVALAACAGAGVWRNQNMQALQNECNKVTTQVKTAQNSLTKLVQSEDVTKALKVSDKQVLKDDAAMLGTLKDAVESASEKVTIPACSVDFFDFGANPAESVRGALKEVQGKASAINDAVASVNKAAAAKTLADAKAKLQKTVDSASKLLSESDGKVADNATRDQLKKAIDTATALLKASKESDPAQYATKPVDDAVAAVNASIETKRQADEKAAQAAAAQRAYTPQNNYNSNSYSGGSSYTPTSNNSSSSGRRMTIDEMVAAMGGEGGGPIDCRVVGTCQ